MEKKCIICGEQCMVALEDLIGYKEDQKFDILYCDECNTSFSDPFQVDHEIYNHIYKHGSVVPGYDRYWYFSEKVLYEKDPFLFLANQEPSYWSIYHFLRTTKLEKKILEVGCGLGYLTYSIFKAGYNIKGLDISHEAIDKATKKYGNIFFQADLSDYSQSNEKYDIIILTEVIEHIDELYDFLNSLKRLLYEDGKIIITTPNKSFFSRDVKWNTELPPIHLSWLSEESFYSIGNKIRMDVNFFDFTDFNQSRFIFQSRRKFTRQLFWPSTLSSSGELLTTATSPSYTLKYLKAILVKLQVFRFLYKFIPSVLKNNISRTYTLSVILTNR